MTPPANTPAAQTPSARVAIALVEQLIACGLREAVLCPGSRSAPLAYALYEAEQAGAVRLHVRTDERVAAFAALGMGKASGVPAMVVTTSGTAVSNLAPAAAEAQTAGVPVLFVTADRPAFARGTWANQTHPAQHGMLAPYTLASLDLNADTADTAGDARDQLQTPADYAQTAWRTATGERNPDGGAGPVHLNVAFTDPLHEHVPWASAPPVWQRRSTGFAAVDRVSRSRATDLSETFDPSQRTRFLRNGGSAQAMPLGEPVDLTEPTVVIAGDGAGPWAREFAEQWNLPLLAEPTSGAKAGLNVVGAYPLVLRECRLGDAVRQVICFGRPTLSRPVAQLLARCRVVHIAAPHEPGAPAGHIDYARTTAVPRCRRPAAEDWTDYALALGGAAATVVSDMMEELAEPWTVSVAREASLATYDRIQLIAAASNSIRALDLVPPQMRREQRILANRGLAGIDGTLSTAWGAACANDAVTRVLIGDLALLHDAGALVLPEAEREQARVQVVLMDDRGGGIFDTLEYGAGDQAALARCFTTAMPYDVAALCGAAGIEHTTVDTTDVLREVLIDPAPGISVVHVPISPRREAELRETLAARVRAAAWAATR